MILKKMVNEAVDKLQREVPDWEFMVKDKLEEINKIKDDRWWISEERELVEIKDPDRTDDFQDKAREDRDHNNLLHYGHY